MMLVAHRSRDCSMLRVWSVDTSSLAAAAGLLLAAIAIRGLEAVPSRARNRLTSIQNTRSSTASIRPVRS